MDIPLATWILALVTFAVGTITPFIYRRVFHGGMSILPFDIKVARKDDHSNAIEVGRVLHMANASARSILIDGVKPPNLKVGNAVWRAGSVVFVDVTESKTIHIPLRDSDPSTVLPFILKSDEVKVLALQYTLRRPEGENDSSADDVDRALDDVWKDSKIRLRINGIFRRYRITETDAQPVRGFSIFVGPQP